jgi:hypothetical protein
MVAEYKYKLVEYKYKLAHDTGDKPRGVTSDVVWCHHQYRRDTRALLGTVSLG